MITIHKKYSPASFQRNKSMEVNARRNGRLFENYIRNLKNIIHREVIHLWSPFERVDIVHLSS